MLQPYTLKLNAEINAPSTTLVNKSCSEAPQNMQA